MSTDSVGGEVTGLAGSAAPADTKLAQWQSIENGSFFFFFFEFQFYTASDLRQGAVSRVVST